MVMIHAIIILNVKNPADIDTVRDLLRKQRRLSLLEPGCERFEVYHSNEDPAQFVLCEWWADQAALDAHRKAKAYTEIYAPKVIPLVDRTAHPSTMIE